MNYTYNDEIDYYDNDIDNDNMIIKYVNGENTPLNYYTQEIKEHLKNIGKTSIKILGEIIKVSPSIVKVYGYYRVIKIFF
jgi:hypothetical protein